LNKKTAKNPILFKLKLQAENSELMITIHSDTLLGVISRIGGLFKGLSFIMLLLVSPVSKKLFMSKIIDEMFLIKKHPEEKSGKSSNSVRSASALGHLKNRGQN
jgi:hypothetical protein